MSSKDDKESKEYIGDFDSPEQSRSRLKAIKILGSRRLSAYEMNRRLMNKGETGESAQETVEWLEKIGAVDDTEYAAAIVSHYSAKGYGLVRIKDELYRRGIPRDMWDAALAPLEDMSQSEAVQRFLEKKLRGGSDKDDLRRAADALCRRGFSYDEARTGINIYLENLEGS